MRVGLENYSFYKLKAFYVWVRKRESKEIELECKDQVYLDFKILQSMTAVISFLLLWVILVVSQETTHISKAKHGLEGWRPPLRLPLLCAAMIPTRKVVSGSVTYFKDVEGCLAGGLLCDGNSLLTWQGFESCAPKAACWKNTLHG